MDKPISRCAWAGTDELMIRYHDEEWGVPVHDDRKIFEFLVLESAQAGLSWKTILHKREGYRRLFAEFDPEKVAQFTPERIESMLLDPSIIRNRLKIRAAVDNAARFLDVQKEFGTFAAYMWQFVGGTAIHGKSTGMNDIPAVTPAAETFAKDLKKRGFKFLGPTVIYAHMQACGMANDHVATCFRYVRDTGKTPSAVQ